MFKPYNRIRLEIPETFREKVEKGEGTEISLGINWISETILDLRILKGGRRWIRRRNSKSYKTGRGRLSEKSTTRIRKEEVASSWSWG